ncbi:MAG: RluA family pseudouridine synthase [Lachnospiraceae bacterium]|nr:RluA family pseudouridine synthase [Lachnospiraceae bacterium]
MTIPEILFEDKHIIVVNKPSGIPVQTDKIGEKDLLSILRSHLKEQGEAPEVFPVHRLDQPVSGLVVLAKTHEAAAALSKGIQGDSFSKDYRAKVFMPSGFLENKASSFELKDYLLKQKDNTSKVVPAGTRGAKEAVLTYEIAGTDPAAGTAELLVHLKTGRHHQIRVQLSHAGLPILGDRKYGTKESLEVSDSLGIGTIALTAYRLKFIHPATGKAMEFTL